MGESSRKSGKSREATQRSKKAQTAGRKRMVNGSMWFVLLAVALVAALFILKEQTGGEAEMAYPDLEQVESGQAPEGFDEENQPVLGNASAPFQIVVFSDYKCPYCKLWMEEVLPEIKEAYIDQGKARLVYVDMAFLARDSVLAALAGETLYQMDPAYFWKYHGLMTERQGDKGTEWATYAFITELVEKEMPEVPFDRFKEDFKREKYIKNIKRDLDIADKHGVQGVPTVFINGVKFEDPTFDEVRKYIEENS
ncbi:DsbA family protein [Paenibacillus sp. DMB20]|uniref:DsbA family protein n=1 Tax=Paenibacillus sp. DMB20 TaxID=1642570 RepID=UPI00069C1AE3|nr:DsbA family protein [Paenibacillus sp. DMB20]